MMYEDKFVAVIKCDGKILREVEDVIWLPFLSEYSILMKNLSNRTAVVNICIDGRNVTDSGLVVYPNKDIELERFVDSGTDSKGYHFKFIKKTKDIQDHRGDKIDDGYIRIEWRYEREMEYIPIPKVYRRYGALYRSSGLTDMDNCWDTYSNSSRDKGGIRESRSYAGSTLYSSRIGNLESCGSEMSFNSVNDTCIDDQINNKPIDDEGITVEGSDSFQGFRAVTIGELESIDHCIVFRLKGFDKSKHIKSIYVNDVIKCRQCGKRWKNAQKYCGSCGSRLID